MASSKLANGILVISALLVIIPLLSLFMASFLGPGEYTIPPLHPTLGNYINLIHNHFLINILNTFIVITMAILVTIIIAVPSAYAMGRHGISYKLWLSALVLLLIAKSVPPASMLIPVYESLWKLGLTNSYIGLALAYQIYVLPFTIWILIGFFMDIPDELDVAAKLDGANALSRFIWIGLPMAIPGLISAIILDFIVLWNEYMYASILISNTASYTAAVVIGQMVTSEYGLSWGVLAASNILTVIPVLFFVGIIHKNLAKAFTGGIKK